jgi:hypothetical protein
MAQKGNKGARLLFLYVNAKTPPIYSQLDDTVPIAQQADWSSKVRKTAFLHSFEPRTLQPIASRYTGNSIMAG